VMFRFVAGLAIGGSSVLGPLYIAEIAPAKWRGRLVGFFQFSIVFGILAAYFSNFVIGTMSFGASEWRWKLGISAVPAAVFFVLLFYIPRSPRWLAKKGRIEEARNVLDLIGEENAQEELRQIVESIDIEHAGEKQRLFSWKYRIPVMLAITVAMFNQLAGINSILYYLNDIFERAGFTKVSGDRQAIVIGATNLCFTMLAMLVIDKIGRKIMLLIGSVGTCVCLAAVRAKGQSLGSFTHWLMTAILSWVFPLLTAHSTSLPFTFFAIMMAVQFFVVLFYFPETKGITLEDMQKKLGIA